MKITIDKESCIGCGMCQSLCEKCFKMEGGKAKVVKTKVVKNVGCYDEECDFESVAENCPVAAIKVEK